MGRRDREPSPAVQSPPGDIRPAMPALPDVPIQEPSFMPPLPSEPPADQEPITAPEPIDLEIDPIVHPSPEPEPIPTEPIAVEPVVSEPSPSPGSFDLEPSRLFGDLIDPQTGLIWALDIDLFGPEHEFLGTREEKIAFYMPGGQPSEFETPIGELKGRDPASLIGLVGMTHGCKAEQIVLITMGDNLTSFTPHLQVRIPDNETIAHYYSCNPIGKEDRNPIRLATTLQHDLPVIEP